MKIKLSILSFLFILNNNGVILSMAPMIKPTMSIPNINVFHLNKSKVKEITPISPIKTKLLQEQFMDSYSIKNQLTYPYYYKGSTQSNGFLQNTPPLLISKSYRQDQIEDICKGKSTKECLQLLLLMFGGSVIIYSAGMHYLYPGGEIFVMPFVPPAATEDPKDIPFSEKSLDQQIIDALRSNKKIEPQEDEIWKFLSDKTSGRITAQTHKIAHIERKHMYIKNIPIALNQWDIITVPLLASEKQ